MSVTVCPVWRPCASKFDRCTEPLAAPPDVYVSCTELVTVNVVVEPTELTAQRPLKELGVTEPTKTGFPAAKVWTVVVKAHKPVAVPHALEQAPGFAVFAMVN